MVWTHDEYRRAYGLIEYSRSDLTPMERSFLIDICIDYNAGRADVSTNEKDALRCLFISYTEEA